MSSTPERNAAKLLHAAALVALAAIWLAMLLLGRGELDRSVAQALYAGGHPALVLAARVLTAIGEPTVVILVGILVAGWLWLRSRARLALALILVILIGRGLAEVQKYWVARPRPDLEPQLAIVKTASFPSGHAANSMILCLALALALASDARRRYFAVCAALLLSFFIGLSRVMLGVHWPSDVIGGWTFGMLWVLLTLRPAERLFRSSPEPEEISAG